MVLVRKKVEWTAAQEPSFLCLKVTSKYRKIAMLGPCIPFSLSQAFSHQPSGMNDASLQSFHGTFTSCICRSNLFTQFFYYIKKFSIFALGCLTAAVGGSRAGSGGGRVSSLCTAKWWWPTIIDNGSVSWYGCSHVGGWRMNISNLVHWSCRNVSIHI